MCAPQPGETLAVERQAAELIIEGWRQRLFDVSGCMRCLSEHRQVQQPSQVQHESDLRIALRPFSDEVQEARAAISFW